MNSNTHNQISDNSSLYSFKTCFDTSSSTSTQYNLSSKRNAAIGQQKVRNQKFRKSMKLSPFQK